MNLTLVIIANCANMSNILQQIPMFSARSATALQVSQINFCASYQISTELLSRAKKGAREKAATKIAMKPNPNWSNLFKHVQTGSNLFKLNQNRSVWFKMDLIGLNLIKVIKIVQTESNWIKLTLVITANCANMSNILHQIPMFSARSATALRVSQINFCASNRISTQLLSRAKKGARGKAATKIVMKPNCSTEMKIIVIIVCLFSFFVFRFCW